MYLKLQNKIRPKKAAALLMPDTPPDEIESDYENVYEWAYASMPGLPFSLNISRDHGMAEVADEVLDKLTKEEELEMLPTSGPTYIAGIDRSTDSVMDEIPEMFIQRISDTLHMAVFCLPGRRINCDAPDPPPIKRFDPKVRVS